MKKVTGYIIALVGLGLMIVGFGFIDILELDLGIPKALLSSVPIIGIGAIIVGSFIITRSSSGAKQKPEVPIYEGDTIVGYRRH